jgi:hypothetical protein
MVKCLQWGTNLIYKYNLHKFKALKSFRSRLEVGNVLQHNLCEVHWATCTALQENHCKCFKNIKMSQEEKCGVRFRILNSSYKLFVYLIAVCRAHCSSLTQTLEGYLSHLKYLAWKRRMGQQSPITIMARGHTVAQWFESLHNKPEGHRIDSWWCHWNFSKTSSFRPHYGPGVDSASHRNE